MKSCSRVLRFIPILLGIALFIIPQFGFAEGPANEETEESKTKTSKQAETEEAKTKTSEQAETENIYKLDEIMVTSPRVSPLAPLDITINVEKHEQAGTAQNIIDILKDSAIIDFRGSSDLVHESDTIYMRGFDTRNFVMAWDGLSIGKTEGQGGRFVDFSSVPFAQIESIEILPGPHSALYSGRAIGGVINVKQKTPKKYETLKPNFSALTSYRSYNTQTHRINIDGGADAFIYGFSYEYYHTDGYLRHHQEDSETIAGSLGYILPGDGYIKFSMSYWDADRESPEKNDPASSDYDSSYPGYDSGADPGSAALRKDSSYSYRLNFQKPTNIGKWTLAADYTHGNRDSYYDDGAQLTGRPSPKRWNTYAANIQDEFLIFKDHLITVGADHQQQRANNQWQEENLSYAGFIQDKWSIMPRLSATGGLRYEYWNIWWRNREGNLYYDESAGDYVKKDYNHLLPKLFLTYGLDDLLKWLRDTSLSFGASKIWSLTSYCPH